MKAKQRLAAVNRLLAVQQQTHRLAEWKLAEARREAAALEERQAALMVMLDSDIGMAPSFAAAAMKQLRAIGAEKELTKKREAVEADRLRAEAQRFGQAKRLCEDAKVDAAREAERKTLSEAIELLIRRDTASLP